MNQDLISRQAAIDALGEEPEVWTEKDEYAQGLNNQWHYDVNALKALPSAQPEHTETHSCDYQRTETHDLVSRRAVMAKLNMLNDGALYTHADYVDAVRSVPSVEPESRREWYMKGYRDAQDATMHESCTDCPLYDHDRHNCPRFNKVIPETLKEVMAERRQDE